MLRLDDVTAGYGTGNVLNGVSFDISQGDLVAVLGRNGVGKSTLLRAILGEVKLSSGTVEFDGREVGREAVHRRARSGIAYVPQGRQIFPSLSVLDNLKVAAYGTRRKNPDGLLADVLDQFPVLSEKSKLLGGGLSGGQQQILALGRALMSEPKLLLLDEPSEGIQPSIVDQIARHIRNLNGDRGITVIIVEQNLEFATGVADHALLMDKGTIVRSLPASEILKDRDLQHEYLGV